jgi:DNA helicase-2/ATP-dependent DNA helicase PcrA
MLVAQQTNSMSFLNDLNPPQREAVEAVDGPVMIVAGAGSGKTRALTYRVAHLVSLGVRPYEILALTFTNKAANEMKSRIIDLVGLKSREVWMGTFHSIFARILRVEAEKIGYGKNFTIYDSDDSLSVVKGAMSSLGLSQQQFSPHAIRSRISLAKNHMMSPKEYGKIASDLFEEKAAAVYEHYERTLRANNAMDFDDLLVRPIELFEKSPKTLEKYQYRFKHILVDEYQDTNRAQYVLIKMLGNLHRNLCVVGDDAQSIYAFRGADIRNILDFEKDYPDCKIFRLEQNYRSTRTILAAADEIMKNNRDQIKKNLWTENPQGDQITLLETDDEKEEGYQVAQKILRESGRLKLDLKDFAVLYRTNAQSRSLEDALRRNGIPYVIVGGTEFYRRKEVKDVLAYLKVVVNPKDDESLLRVINYPYRGIGETTVRKIRASAERRKETILETISQADSLVGINERTKKQILEFSELIKKYVSLRESISASELARTLVDQLGILSDFKKDGTPEAMSRWENVQELLSALTEFSREKSDGTLSSFLEEVSLISDVDKWESERNAVTLMTLHSAKGLEFPVVFITGLEEGLLPLYPSEIEHAELEEERRLFYVGVTRTMKKLYLSCVRSRIRYGDVTFPVRSRFVDEIPHEILSVERKGARQRERVGLTSEKSFLGSEVDFRSRRRERIPAIDLDFDQGRANVHDGFEEADRTWSSLKVGCIVEHEMFGRGQVLGLSGRGDSAKAVVHFEDAGTKHLMLKYANLRVV